MQSQPPTYFLLKDVETNFKEDTENNAIHKEANRTYQESKCDLGMKTWDKEGMWCVETNKQK